MATKDQFETVAPVMSVLVGLPQAVAAVLLYELDRLSADVFAEIQAMPLHEKESDDSDDAWLPPNPVMQAFDTVQAAAPGASRWDVVVAAKYLPMAKSYISTVAPRLSQAEFSCMDAPALPRA